MIEWWWLLVAAFSLMLLVWWVSTAFFLREYELRQRLVDEMRVELDEMLGQAKVYQQRASEAEKMAKVHLEANASFEKQRDEAWSRYHAAGIGAGNAQAMLLRSLEGAVRELNKYRAQDQLAPVQVNEGLREIVAEFKREHGSGP